MGVLLLFFFPFFQLLFLLKLNSEWMVCCYATVGEFKKKKKVWQLMEVLPREMKVEGEVCVFDRAIVTEVGDCAVIWQSVAGLALGLEWS